MSLRNGDFRLIHALILMAFTALSLHVAHRYNEEAQGWADDRERAFLQTFNCANVSAAKVPAVQQRLLDLAQEDAASATRHLPRVGIVTMNIKLKPKPAKPPARSLWMHPMSLYNKFTYAKRHNYDLIVEDNRVVEKSRDVAWTKIPIWKKWLPKYQWLMWADMDALFMNYDFELESILDDSYDVIITADFNGLNMGMMFVRNSNFTYALFDLMWNVHRRCWKPWEEQMSLMLLTNASRTPFADQINPRIKVVPQRTFNSYPEPFAEGHKLGAYRDGDFVAHFPNCGHFKDCRERMQGFLDKANKKFGLFGAPDNFYPGEVDLTNFVVGQRLDASGERAAHRALR